jgi:hypothetical protein
MSKFPTPVELDAQSPVKIDRWVEVDSKEHRDLDENPSMARKWINLGLREPAYLFTDVNGRVWGKGENGKYYPFHFKSGKSLIGYRLSERAAN